MALFLVEISSHLLHKNMNSAWLIMIITIKTLLWDLRISLAQEQQGFISIDCGSPVESYRDSETGITYVSDSKYMNFGKTWNVPSTSTAGLPRNLATLRSFPDGNKTCYKLQPLDATSKYLIRASFLYGNYDGLNSFPTFDMYLGVTHVQTINSSSSTLRSDEWVVHEFIALPTTTYVSVCLLKTTVGTPFISALELRPITAAGNTVYGAVTGSLAFQTLERYDVGTTASYRFPNDVFDRFWASAINTDLTIITTTFNVSSAMDPYLPPSIVMQSAEANEKIYWKANVPSSNPSLFTCMHFAELEEVDPSTDLREMEINLNDQHWYGPFTPQYLKSTNVCSNGTFRVQSGAAQFDWVATNRSTLPVLVSAVELYMAIKLASQTDEGNAAAMNEIRDKYDIKKRWTGDPCLPRGYGWKDVVCTGDDPPKIKELKLSKSALTGPIQEAFGRLGSISVLDLSENELTGDIPDSLGELNDLDELDLQDNDLSGDVPESLLRKAESGRLKLNVSGNPKLCSTEACRKKEKKIPIAVIVGASVPAALILIYLLTICAIILSRRRKLNASHSRNPPGDVVDTEHDKGREVETGNGTSSACQAFTFSEVTDMTSNFAHQIGKGSFGPVFYGELPDGHKVAVKKLSPGSIQGPKEFRTEVEMLSRAKHQNIVSFYGYCCEDQHMILIYQYIAGGNLRKALSGVHAMDWNQRLQIALGAAQGLEYLHQCQPAIIHRDVKSSNILLNEDCIAKIADFGLSKSGTPDNATHISTAVKGTPGYLDPEYSFTNWLNEKSDVYSFGIVLLELTTGKSPIIVESPRERIHIVEWVNSNLQKGNHDRIFDPIILGNCDVPSFWKVVALALRCTEYSRIERPSMREVVSELKEAIFPNHGTI